MKRLIILFFMLSSFVYADIGEITAINGKAIILRGDKKLVIGEHTKIQEKDIIKTMGNSKLQIIFSDKTVISLGQKTTFEIQEYLFSQTKPKAKFNISKGLFKSITGKIGHIAPKNFQLKTQNATIGVRGTTIIGETSKDIDTIICSSGKIVVSSFGKEVAVNMGEKTVVKRGHKPVVAIKVSPKNISKLDKTVNPVKKQTFKKSVEQTPIKPKQTFQKEKIQEITSIKDQWGDWNKKDILKEDIKTPVKEKPQELEPQKPNQDLASLQDLRDRAGQRNPTYKGEVSGFVNKQPNKIHGKIHLNVDLGRGKVKGNLKINTANARRHWNAKIKDGTVDKNGAMDFGISNGKNLHGSGDGTLSGEKLQHANGSFSLQDNDTHDRVYGTFKARKN